MADGNLSQSTIAEHAAQELHFIDWKEVEVVDTLPHYHQMNRDEGNLPPAYNSLLNYPQALHYSTVVSCMHFIFHSYHPLIISFFISPPPSVYPPSLLVCKYAHTITCIPVLYTGTTITPHSTSLKAQVLSGCRQWHSHDQSIWAMGGKDQ